MHGETPLQYAVYKNGGWLEGVLFLLERGADRTIKLTDGDFAGTTAADAARRNGHDELAAAIDNFKPGKCLIA